jgi:hypothetical protein
MHLRKAYSGRTQTTVLLEGPEVPDTESLLEDEMAANAEATHIRPLVTIFTYGSRINSAAARYWVAW